MRFVDQRAYQVLKSHQIIFSKHQLVSGANLRQAEVVVGQGMARVDAIREVSITGQPYYRAQSVWHGEIPAQWAEASPDGE